MLELIFSQTNKLKQLDQLIRLKCTGKPESLACKLGISKRHVRNYISVLEEMGADISYCRSRQSYIYKATYKLTVEISIVELDETNCKLLGGGSSNKNLHLFNYQFKVF